MIVKDGRKVAREDLTQEELDKWGTPSFLNYLSKRVLTKKTGAAAAATVKKTVTGSAIRSAAGTGTELKRKVMAANKNKPVEKGIKIHIGAPQMPE